MLIRITCIVQIQWQFVHFIDKRNNVIQQVPEMAVYFVFTDEENTLHKIYILIRLFLRYIASFFFFCYRQVALADIILINKIDIADANSVKTLKTKIR